MAKRRGSIRKVTDWYKVLGSCLVGAGALFFIACIVLNKLNIEEQEGKVETIVVCGLVALLSLYIGFNFYSGIVINSRTGTVTYPFLYLFRRSIKMRDIDDDEFDYEYSCYRDGSEKESFNYILVGKFGTATMKLSSRGKRKELQMAVIKGLSEFIEKPQKQSQKPQKRTEQDDSIEETEEKGGGCGFLVLILFILLVGLGGTALLSHYKISAQDIKQKATSLWNDIKQTNK